MKKYIIAIVLYLGFVKASNLENPEMNLGEVSQETVRGEALPSFLLSSKRHPIDAQVGQALTDFIDSQFSGKFPMQQAGFAARVRRHIDPDAPVKEQMKQMQKGIAQVYEEDRGRNSSSHVQEVLLSQLFTQQVESRRARATLLAKHDARKAAKTKEPVAQIDPRRASLSKLSVEEVMAKMGLGDTSKVPASKPKKKK